MSNGRSVLLGCALVLCGAALLSRTGQAGEILDNTKLKEVLKAGVALTVIEDMIKASTTQFVYSASEIVEIKKAAEEGKMPPDDTNKLLKIIIAEANKGQTRMREMVVRFLNMCVNGTEQEYSATMRALLREGKGIVPYLLEKIEEENEIKRKGILDAIMQIGDKTDSVVRSVRLMLDDRHMAVRAQAAKTVAALKGPDTCQELIDGMDPKKHENLDGIALALGYLGDAKAINSLTNLLKDSSDENACVAAAFALGQLRAKDERATGALLDGILSDRWDQLRFTCAQSLSLIGEPRTVSYVLRAFQRYREGRPRLIGTLAKFKYAEAIEFLVECTNEDNPDLRKKAMETLQVVTGEKYDNYDDWLSWWNINKVRPDIPRLGVEAAVPQPKEAPKP